MTVLVTLSSHLPIVNYQLIIILLPALHLDVLQFQVAECLDEGLGQTGIGHQRNVVIDGTTTDAVAVGQLTFRVVLRYVDDQFDW